jgi:acyl-coenzyme A thioesterase PaaI-like protein
MTTHDSNHPNARLPPRSGRKDVVGMIADSAAGYAAMTMVPASASELTVEYKVNLVAPADGEKLIARAQVVRPGRTLL